MGTYCAPLLAGVFLYSYEVKTVLKLIGNEKEIN
jgi:hypothetical protein